MRLLVNSQSLVIEHMRLLYTTVIFCHFLVFKNF